MLALQATAQPNLQEYVLVHLLPNPSVTHQTLNLLCVQDHKNFSSRSSVTTQYHSSRLHPHGPCLHQTQQNSKRKSQGRVPSLEANFAPATPLHISAGTVVLSQQISKLFQGNVREWDYWKQSSAEYRGLAVQFGESEVDPQVLSRSWLFS